MTARMTARMTEPEIPVEEARTTRESYEALLARLSRQSVTKRYECYRDIDWDAPEMHIDADDPRWELPSTRRSAAPPGIARSRKPCAPSSAFIASPRS